MIRILYDISVSDTIYDTYIDRIFEKQNLDLKSTQIVRFWF